MSKLRSKTETSYCGSVLKARGKGTSGRVHDVSLVACITAITLKPLLGPRRGSRGLGGLRGFGVQGLGEGFEVAVKD